MQKVLATRDSGKWELWLCELDEATRTWVPIAGPNPMPPGWEKKLDDKATEVPNAK